MNVFEIVGQAQILRDESNRQLAAAMAQSVRTLFSRIGHILGSAMSRLPTEQIHH